MNAQAQINFELPIKSVSIDAMVAARRGALERIERAAELLREAADMAARAHLGEFRIGIEGSHGRTDHCVTGQFARPADFLAACRTALDQGAWSYLMHESGMLTLMDAKARAEWNETLRNGKEVPELTAETVAATFARLFEARGDYFERGVIEAFRALSWDYKTNNPCKFGKRVIVEWLCDSNRYFNSPNSRKTDQVDDLLRVFHVMDGKPEPDHRSATYRMMRDGEAERRAENDYIDLKWFKNGNGHITFKRPDLVERLNEIVARHYPGALPARC